MSSTEGLLRRVDRVLADSGVEAGAHLLVGCSGGPDSIALLAALARIAPARGLRLTAAHLLHGLRGQAEQQGERAAVEAATARLGVALAGAELPPGLVAEEAGTRRLSVEQVARTHRLEFLRVTARERGCAFVVLGHTRDDQVETLIMRFFQGSGPRGLGGIRSLRGDLLRPLLSWTRRDVLSFLAGEGLAYHLDSSNADQSFLRNRIRHSLVPVIRDVFPGHVSALLRLAAKMTAVADLLEAQPADVGRWQTERHGFSVEARAFDALPAALRVELLYELVDKMRRRHARVPYGFVSRAAAQPRRAGKWAVRWGGVRISQRAGRVFVEEDIVSFRKTGYFKLVAEPSATWLRAGPYQVSVAEKVEPSAVQTEVASVERGLVKLPAVIRSRRRGDRIHTSAGTRSLKKLFSQWRIPEEGRNQTAVLADACGVVGVVALPWGVCVADRGPAPRCGSFTFTLMTGKRS